ncbi:MAG: phage tail protein I [Pseudomonas sp.]|uniref:phage tail protein I n=1 Tax=Pseudomonas sp. TaxID=306 RepID=UPI003D0DE51F
MVSLLPHNSTLLERAIEAATTESITAPLRVLYNPDTCPAHLLHQLAWAWSVDRWDENWPEAIKRSVIRSAFYVHSRKGTIGALRRVVEPLGYLIEVREWWQTAPEGQPGTFALQVGVLDQGITEEMYEELTRLIDDAKPVSRHLTGLAITLSCSGYLRLPMALAEGEEIDVYPPLARDIDVTGTYGHSGRETQIEYLDVYS